MSHAVAANEVEHIAIGEACRHTIHRTFPEAYELLAGGHAYNAERLRAGPRDAEALLYGTRIVNTTSAHLQVCGIGAALPVTNVVLDGLGFSEVRSAGPALVDDTFRARSEVVDKRNVLELAYGCITEWDRRAYIQRNEWVTKSAAFSGAFAGSLLIGCRRARHAS